MEPVRRSEKLVERLFDHFLNRLDMPDRWEQRAKSTASHAERARIVSDYVAGMTDPYAEQEHARLFDASGNIG